MNFCKNCGRELFDKRIARNQKTGQRVEVPARRISCFKPSKDLRDQINP